MSRQTRIQAGWKYLHERISRWIPTASAATVQQIGLAGLTLQTLKSRFPETFPAKPSPAGEWLREFGDPVIRFLLELARFQPELDTLLPELVELFPPEPVPSTEILKLWGRLVDAQQSPGVYYTPRPLARFVIRAARQQLERVNVPIHQAKVLEPAVGTGIFLMAWLDEMASDVESSQLPVLGNLNCVDLSPSAIVVAQYLLAHELVQRGWPLLPENFPRFHAGHSLSAVPDSIYADLGLDAPDLNQVIHIEHYQLIMGNPPFGALTAPSGQWISDLLHGRIKGPGGQRSYFEVAGKRLGERKTWLHDDYVKFIRYAQWQTERAPAACLALVLNSGFVSNLSFRGVRYHLADCFPQLEIIDFGGDQRNYRIANDENIFQIETGIAALIASRSNPGLASQRHLTRLRGPRLAKLKWCDLPQGFLQKELKVTREELSPRSPDYRLDRARPESTSGYELGWSLDQVFVRKWSVPVTARDHLVIDWTPERLQARIEDFLDPKRSTDEIRQQFFPAPRSARYPRGDSRSWKLEEVRERLRREDWRQWVRPCAYRPFDHRFVLWHPLMIDWPRTELIEALDLNRPGQATNPCLIARRQAPETPEYSYFWGTLRIPIDGIIRSDNRGNEYCFPLYRSEQGQCVGNLHPEFIAYLQRKWKVDAIDPETLFHLIVAIFHSSEYRREYRESLREEIPRLFFPQELALARKLAELGREVFSCQTDGVFCSSEPVSGPRATERTPSKAPRFSKGRLHFGDGSMLEIPEEIWEFRIGSHQVMKKYLRYRVREQMLERLPEDLGQLRDRIATFQSIMQAIDKTIRDAGGFRDSFDLKGQSDALSNESSATALPMPR